MTIKYLCVLTAVVLLAGCDQLTRDSHDIRADEYAIEYAEKAAARVNAYQHTWQTIDSKEKLLQQAKDNLVFIQGDTYIMGDAENLVYNFHTADLIHDGQPSHKVTLSAFYIAKYKVSNEEFAHYLKDKDLTLDYKLSPYRLTQWQSANALPHLPAHLFWQQAHDYCQWLGEETGLAFSLPTEAQWEYVARNGGKRWSTYDEQPKHTADQLYYGIVRASNADKKAYAEQQQTELGYDQALPRDFYPPNELGVYDLLNNGFEWMQDWYDPDYYSDSPLLDPQGPDTPVQGMEGNTLRDWNFKAVRGGLAEEVPAISLHRTGFPLQYPAELVNSTVRCVVNPGQI